MRNIHAYLVSKKCFYYDLMVSDVKHKYHTLIVIIVKSAYCTGHEEDTIVIMLKVNNTSWMSLLSTGFKLKSMR